MNYSGFTMKTKPWAHQLKALQYLYDRSYGALYTKPGSGKTKVFIDLIVNKGFKRVLVVAPKKPCKVWKPQFRIHSDINPQQIVELYKLETKGKAALLKTYLNRKDTEPVIFICNYDSVWRKPLDKMWLYKRLGIDCVICDESHRIKTPGSRCSCFLSRIGNVVPNRYLLTGTPLAENPLDVYAQYRFLDRSIYGTNYDAFCAEYTNIDPVLTARFKHTVLDKKQPYKNLDKLREKMFSCAFYMKSTVKLPRTTRMVVRIPMPKELENVYAQVEKDGAVIMGDGYMTVNNVLAMATRKQQITSGYLKLEYDDKTEELKRISTYRRTFLLKFLKGLPEDEPVVVFAKFKKDLYSIRKVAERLGCGYSEVSGSEDTLGDWKDGKTRVLGVQYASGSESIDLTRAHLCIFYSLEISLAKYKQALKRVHRPGQESPCIYYHFVATRSSGATIDEDILTCLKNKEDYVTAVMRGDFEVPF